MFETVHETHAKLLMCNVLFTIYDNDGRYKSSSLDISQREIVAHLIIANCIPSTDESILGP